jgi:hypothetical protein
MANRDGRRDSKARGSRGASVDTDHGQGSYEQDGWDEPRLMDFARKIVRGGAEVVISTKDAIGERAAEVKSREIPREVVESVAHLTARTKDELVSLMAREFKTYLEKMDLASEARSLLENYTLDVNMRVRLRPNEPFPEDEDPPEDEEAADAGDEGDDVEAGDDEEAADEDEE